MSHETPRSLEKDGFRAQLAVHSDGRVLPRSRQGTDMTSAFPDLQQRFARRGAGAAEAARQWSAHYVVFDLLHAGGDLTRWPYQRRRAALESLFANRRLQAPLTLCPSTTDPAAAREWLEWAFSAGWNTARS
ncbi:hypothetical protein [Streptomyces sp. NPDC051132]|uniref:ATP-dependent DNA ligase n=1 Tax=unclassified Streptomyces TaxID=2593676 RepID=UPI00341AB7D8